MHKVLLTLYAKSGLLDVMCASDGAKVFIATQL